MENNTIDQSSDSNPTSTSGITVTQDESTLLMNEIEKDLMKYVTALQSRFYIPIKFSQQRIIRKLSFTVKYMSSCLDCYE